MLAYTLPFTIWRWDTFFYKSKLTIHLYAMGREKPATSIWHQKTPYLTYIRVLNHHSSWKNMAILNTLHHFFMYAYFGGVSLFRPILPFTGYLQLLVGIMGEILIIYSKMNSHQPEPVWPNVVSAGLLGTYAVLFTRELRQFSWRRNSRKKSQWSGEDVAWTTLTNVYFMHGRRPEAL
jgi:hypothetical protein